MTGSEDAVSIRSSQMDMASASAATTDLPPEILEKQERYFAKVLEMYEDRDNRNEWQRSCNDKHFKLWRTSPAGTNVNMHKVRMTMKSSF